MERFPEFRRKTYVARMLICFADEYVFEDGQELSEEVGVAILLRWCSLLWLLGFTLIANESDLQGQQAPHLHREESAFRSTARDGDFLRNVGSASGEVARTMWIILRNSLVFSQEVHQWTGEVEDLSKTKFAPLEEVRESL